MILTLIWTLCINSLAIMTALRFSNGLLRTVIGGMLAVDTLYCLYFYLIL